jgi:hypothetical protein
MINVSHLDRHLILAAGGDLHHDPQVQANRVRGRHQHEGPHRVSLVGGTEVRSDASLELNLKTLA